MTRLEKEIERTNEMREFEEEFRAKYNFFCGVDEVGRGPLAGPVMTAAVILPKDCDILYINDSKKVSEKRRKEVAAEIMEKAISVGFGEVDNITIDKINILNATKCAMKNAIMSLMPVPELVLIDAVRLPDLMIPQENIIKGDAKSQSIAAASIVAKVRRDELMVSLSEKYPEYNFASNKGYGTKEHMDALRKYGPSEIHRKTFLKFLNDEE